MAEFPHSHVRDGQRQSIEAIAASANGLLIEGPTGCGKTDIGTATLRAYAARGIGPLFYISPTKMQTEQAQRTLGKRALPVLGRSEYACLYYEDKGVARVNAAESPCYMLACGHRVDQESGRTKEEDAAPCPYFQAKFEALRGLDEGGIVVTTLAFFLLNRLLVKGWREREPAYVVLDEVHRAAEVARRTFEYNVTDRHLLRAAELMKQVDRKDALLLVQFVRAMRAIARKREAIRPTLVPDKDVLRLIEHLKRFDADRLAERIQDAVARGKIDPLADREALKQLETAVRSIPRLLHMLGYALADDQRGPLNYVVAAYYREDDPAVLPPKRRAQYHLQVRSYYVRPLIAKALGPRVLAYSATIGDPELLGFETGIEQPFLALPPPFSSERTRVYLPSDTPNLAMKTRRRDDLKKSIKRIAASAKRFSENGQRSLIVVVSDEERQLAVRHCQNAGLDVVTYGTGMNARQAAAHFIGGGGDVLIGTAAHYAEGVDFRGGSAPVVFFLRPGYPPPDDPQAQFEKKRFGNRAWALWNWRVMLQALQVRGRNIRGARDLGVTIFVSQQFRRFLFPALPEWLKPAYRGNLPLDGCVEDALMLFATKAA